MPVLSTALLNPGSGGTIAVGGIGWTSAGNVTASDNARATSSLAIGQAADYLYASGFNASVPTSAQVIGIDFTVERQENFVSNYIKDSSVIIVKLANLSQAGNNHANANFWQGSGIGDETIAYGNALDLHGFTSISASEANASTFGVAIRPVNANSLGTTTAEVDNVKLRVTYITRNPQKMIL